MIAQNEELKSKLRLHESDIIQNDSKQSAAVREIRKYSDQADKQTEEIELLTRKVVQAVLDRPSSAGQI